MNCCKFLSFKCWALLALATVLSTVFLVASTPVMSEEVALTTDGSLKRDPVFVLGGDQLVYAVDENETLIRLMVLDIKSGAIEPLHADATTNQFETAFSSDGRYRAITHNKSNLAMEMIIRDTQENTETKVTHDGRGGTRSPVFSPDNQRVIYCFAETGPQHIWSVNLLSEDKKQLTQGQGVNNWPSMTPDGKTIVFSSSRDGTYEIYAMDANGDNQRRITDNNASELRPRLSPDGTQIAYVSFHQGNREVFVMNVDGSNVRQVTHSPERDDYPTWHPDGRRLVVVSERAGRHDLFLIDVSK